MKKQLMRSGRDKKIAGVLAFGYGAGIVAYIILWIIAPEASDY